MFPDDFPYDWHCRVRWILDAEEQFVFRVALIKERANIVFQPGIGPFEWFEDADHEFLPRRQDDAPMRPEMDELRGRHQREGDEAKRGKCKQDHTVIVDPGCEG